VQVAEALDAGKEKVMGDITTWLGERMPKV
jgi:hypothetical protein